MNSKVRSEIRKVFGVSNNVPVVVIPGSNSRPELFGKHGGWFTKGGKRISSPGSYAKVGWSNMVYKRSTLSIEVGELWIKSELSTLV